MKEESDAKDESLSAPPFVTTSVLTNSLIHWWAIQFIASNEDACVNINVVADREQRRKTAVSPGVAASQGKTINFGLSFQIHTEIQA